MSGEVKGDLTILRSVYANRFNAGMNIKTLSAPEQLALHSKAWQKLSSSSAENVILPNATGLPVAWAVTVANGGAATLTVQTAGPVNLQNITAGRVYEFVLLDNSDAAGTWHVNFLEDSETVVSDRYVGTFDATSSWGTAVGGYYSITIAAATHQRGIVPGFAGVSEESGTDYVGVALGDDGYTVAANGDVTVRVPESPDCRFAGRIILV